MSRSSVGGRALVATTILAENGSLSCASCPTQLRHETHVTGYGTTNYGLTNRYVVNDIAENQDAYHNMCINSVLRLPTPFSPPRPSPASVRSSPSSCCTRSTQIG